MARVAVAVLLLCGAALAAASGNPSPKQMTTPCYMRYYNGFCFVQNSKETCTFYSSPSYATFAECSGDSKMGKYVKCADADAELKKTDAFKTCTDKEVLGKPSGPAPVLVVNWWQMSNKDVAGQDMPAGGKQFTEVCGGLDAVKAACGRVKECAGFTFNPTKNCGYLKTATTSSQDRQGWTLYMADRKN